MRPDTKKRVQKNLNNPSLNDKKGDLKQLKANENNTKRNLKRATMTQNKSK